MKKPALLSLAALLALGGSCATLFKDEDKVSFHSSPEEALVLIDGLPAGRTPLELSLVPDRKYAAEFRKEGYLPETVEINAVPGEKWVILDVIGLLIPGGSIPLLVDAITGNWKVPEPGEIFVTLEKAGGEDP
ncbi:MAG: PEGA domain-containing protein [Deltaproteobacteria bacterium]|nr:PEGA domain-containing protein [Deltaproteobacteria bacterium]